MAEDTGNMKKWVFLPAAIMIGAGVFFYGFLNDDACGNPPAGCKCHQQGSTCYTYQCSDSKANMKECK
jgi:hypothetical protein